MIVVLSFSKRGHVLGDRLATRLDDAVHYHSADVAFKFSERLPDWWQSAETIVFIGATGIAVRLIAPCIRSKKTDPAVLVIDDAARYVISLLSGHLGGANQYTLQLAEMLGALPIITTASDQRGFQSPDLFAKNNHCWISSFSDCTKLTSLMVNEEPIIVWNETNTDLDYPHTIAWTEGDPIPEIAKGMLWISKKEKPKTDIPCLSLVPKEVVLGIGCRRGTPKEKILALIEREMKKRRWVLASIDAIGTVDIKANEPGLLEAAKELGLTPIIFSREQIRRVENDFESSEFVRKTIGVGAVSAPVAALLGGEVIEEKIIGDGVTLSIAIRRKDEIMGR